MCETAQEAADDELTEKEEQEDKAVRGKINNERNESKQEHQKEKYFQQTNTHKREE